MAKGLGSLEWVEKTSGKLAWYDRLNMLYQGVRAQMAANKRKKVGEKFRYIELEDIIPPDSPIALESMKYSAEVCPPFLFNHNMRAYFWAKLLDDQRVPVDDEVIFTALMLHDIGLTDTYRQGKHMDSCFTLAGAREAQKLAARHGWSEKRSDLVANAITLHLNLSFNKNHGREAELTSNATGADVVGLKLELLHRDQVDGVIGKFPRLNQKRDIGDVFRLDAKERPCCRMAFFYKTLSMGELIKNAPFTE